MYNGNIKPLADKHWVRTDSGSTRYLTTDADGLAGIQKNITSNAEWRCLCTNLTSMRVGSVKENLAQERWRRNTPVWCISCYRSSLLILWRKLMETYTISSTFFPAEIYPWCRQYTETSYTCASQTSPPPLFQPPHLQNFRQPNNAGNKEVEAAYSCCCCCCCSYFCINSCVEFHSLITIWWGSQHYLVPLHTRHDNRTSEHKRLTCTQFSKLGSDLSHG